MNEKLKFSWSHIIAFIAIIAVSYISFVGITYLTNGDFIAAAVGMSIIDIVFLIFFIGAQQMKASGHKMYRKIVIERILVFGSPIIFIIGMIPMSHFWSVKSQNEHIVGTFKQAINDAKGMFTEYEAYATQRISDYDKNLGIIISNKDIDNAKFRSAGFVEAKANIQRKNMVETLRLQLLSQNFDSLKNVANRWIDKANNGANTWNVFLLGNTREIKSALRNWEDQLKSFSDNELSNESILGSVDKFSSNAAQQSIDQIDGLTSSFVTQKFPTISAIIFAVVIYLMLMFPYFLQDRHTKSIYRLIGTERSKEEHFNKHAQHNQDWNSAEQATFSTDATSKTDLKENSDYQSF